MDNGWITRISTIWKVSAAKRLLHTKRILWLMHHAISLIVSADTRDQGRLVAISSPSEVGLGALLIQHSIMMVNMIHYVGNW